MYKLKREGKYIKQVVLPLYLKSCKKELKDIAIAQYYVEIGSDDYSGVAFKMSQCETREEAVRVREEHYREQLIESVEGIYKMLNKMEKEGW